MATGQNQRPSRMLRSNANLMADIQGNDKQEEVDPGVDNTNVLSAIQNSIRKAMDELGHVSKLILELQTDIDQVKKEPAGLRTVKVGYRIWKTKTLASGA